MSPLPIRPTPHRLFDDLRLGERKRSASHCFTADDIVTFATAHDPQWFHVHPNAATRSRFGRLIASGIHLLAVWRRLDHEMNGDIDWVCGLGMDEMRFEHAVGAGDIVHISSEIVGLRRSASDARYGIARMECKMHLANDRIALSFTCTNLVNRLRPRGRA